jgi:succinyl-CoA synthetase beta subunit
MDLHEYQAKELLLKYKIPLPPFQVIDKLELVDASIDALKTDQVVIKVQIHAGGRGKAGGVKLAKTRQEAKEHVKNLLGMRITNAQTGANGVVAEKLLISPISKFKKEYYLAAAVDRKNAKAIIIASPEGGMDIEEVAAKRPEAILTCPIPLDGVMHSYHLWEIANFMGWKGTLRTNGMEIVKNIGKAFMELDASLIEINPLVSLENDTLYALDAKISIDDNALFRHKTLADLYDVTQISSLESIARHYDLSYIALDGEIGCMVNGAGLAMATMDIIEYHGGRPSNFLDVGGSADSKKVAEAFKIILSDINVKAVLVNIFGGIMNCETLAVGIISAATGQKLQVPVIVRMEGTHVEEGKALLVASGLKIQIATSLNEAAELAVKAVNYAHTN